MKYALIEISSGSSFSDLMSAGKDQFQLIGFYDTIEEAEVERSKPSSNYTAKYRIIIQVW